MAKKHEYLTNQVFEDIIPETVAEALAKWDAGEPVFSVEMGGLGPGYEHCIQTIAFECMRVWLPTLPWPAPGEELPEDWKDRLDELADPYIAALDKMPGGGFSGAQVGAGKNLAANVCRRGYREALRDPVVADRLIQVQRVMPQFDQLTKEAAVAESGK